MSYDSGSVLPAFFAAARTSAPASPILVVDNGSHDDSIALSAATPGVNVMRNAANLGFGRACNAGANAATTDWLLIVNPDVQLSRVDVTDCTRAGDRFGLGAGCVRTEGGRLTTGLRAEPTFLEDLYREVLGRFAPRGVAAKVPPRVRPAAWASGAVLLVRRDEFLLVGGFDERYFLYHEDRDLGARYRRCGLGARSIPTICGDHAKGQSSATSRESMIAAWSFLSWIEYVAKWDGISSAERAAAWGMALIDGVRAATGVRLVRSFGPHLRARADDLLAHLLSPEEVIPTGAPEFYPSARDVLIRLRAKRNRAVISPR